MKIISLNFATFNQPYSTGSPEYPYSKRNLAKCGINIF